MPTRDVGILQCWDTFFGRKDVVIGEDAVVWLDQIFVCIKAGVEKRHRDAAPRVTFISVHSYRDR